MAVRLNSLALVVVIVSIVIFFAAMVMSANAAGKAGHGGDVCKKECHKWSTWAAITCGFAVLLLIIALVMYFYSKKDDLRGVYDQARTGISFE